MTAMDAAEDKIKGLKIGADDYLTKPFDFDELLARLEALARRAHNFAPCSNILQVADLVLDRDLLEVRRGEEVIKLTAKELAILELLMSAPGRVLSRTRHQQSWIRNIDRQHHQRQHGDQPGWWPAQYG